LYRPNFCAECGERVVRERWRAWSSRRFCARCERLLGRAWARPLACVCLVACAAYAAGRLARPAPPPLLFERASLPPPALLTRPHAPTARAEASGASSNDASGARQRSPGGPDSGADGTGAERPTDPAEVVSLCGARTKKGKPCSRRVRGTGRCWQHRGLPAMLPPAKLIVRD
jgi:hypothetical protein